MPTYEYQCSACGHQFEEFQKISDAPIKLCPKCDKEKVNKLVSATSFQLKGTGWYATDFRDKGKPKATDEKTASETKSTSEKTSEKKENTQEKAASTTNDSKGTKDSTG